MTKLKPCPFCGSEDVRRTKTEEFRWILCHKCGCSSTFAKSPSVAIRRWNRRPKEVRR
jgi:Lar family restriction alleviation protein